MDKTLRSMLRFGPLNIYKRDFGAPSEEGLGLEKRTMTSLMDRLFSRSRATLRSRVVSSRLTLASA
jgi:hypothetical protein